ncbi:hypothetical protein HALLA_01095 (plasmid) [Halostagnicola larsenii XH-48]|uniref:Nuclease n=1 Tax=Halostagnicola larsenii XH-48 TaxID=797299 RepID=W0JXA5_9EURY|nr:PKD domain-containing protein [Halostagnicola larsenii]AHG01922.1 hypothetical protein HALLA_01095 [Halostagnicola larsenii XH-48]
MFDSTASILNSESEPLTDDSLIAVWADPTAYNGDEDGNDDAVSYPEDTSIPLVVSSDNAVAFGAPIVQNDTDFNYGNEEFLLNVFDEEIDGESVVFDEGHGQFYDTDEFSTFIDYAETNGYTVEGTTDLASDLGGADAAIVTSPEGSAFTQNELAAVTSYVNGGGTLLLFDQSDFSNYDATDNLNEIAAAIDAPFRFNDDQVYDPENNVYAEFVPTTSNFNTEFEYFEEREGLGFELDRDKTYTVEVVEVTDGDTIDVAFEDGQEEAIRTLGFDTPETGSATNTERAEEWEGIESYDYLESAGEAATAFAREQLSSGDTVELSFDSTEPVRDEYGRVLGYLTYDASGDGTRDTLYNRRVVEEGHARVYGSGFARHDEFLAAEFAARDAGLGVWSESDPSDSSPIRDRPVEDLFFPNPESIVTTAGPVSPHRVPVFAASSATRSGAETTYEGDVPLAAVDYDARLAYLGAPIISETYEEAEDYPVDTSTYENFAFVTELINELSDREDGPVLIEGGHGQFNLEYSLSNEDAAYYQRYLEGQDVLFEQVNDVTTAAASERLAEARALIITTPASAFTENELAAVASFAEEGGTVVLMGSASAPGVQRGYLNNIAAGVDSDLRLGTGSVTDAESNLNDEATIPVTSNLNETEAPSDQHPIARISPDSTEATIGERLSFGVEDTSGNERWIDSLAWDLGDGTAATGWWTDHQYDEPGEYTVTLTATDNKGTETTDTITIPVEDLTQPIARLTASTTNPSVNERVTFRVENSSGNERWIDSLEWTFGDGTTAEGWWNAHRYDEPGEYTVTLTATDNTGAETTETITMTVD